MKKGIVLIGIVLSFASCDKTKDWKCTTYVNGNKAGETVFTGTREEMEAYQGVNVVLGNVYETKCK